MSILPMYSLSKFARAPQKVLMLCEPYTVLTSHNEEKAVLLKPEIFEKIKETDFWRELCEEWWEAHDKETLKVVKKGKKIMETGNKDTYKV